ncbi:FCD domain-containing protein [Cupriavidus sp. DF5525]|uniref:FadR/GntR family transcriptional regulator n=1 Tax=Cupriavidus sp. DF5525 TaxID=3160989 RepID=UPI0032DF9BA8
MVLIGTMASTPAALPVLRDDQPAVTVAVLALRAMLEQHLARQERRLPPERALAASLGVSRGIVRRALDVLEQDAAVVRHVGRGTFIASGADDALPILRALVTGGALALDAQAGPNAHEMLAARLALEPAICELSAQAASRADLERMEACLRHRESATRVEEYDHWDLALHRSIAGSTGNALLIEMLEMLNCKRRTAPWRRFRHASMPTENRVKSDAQHRAILDAIRRGQPAEASAAMRAHLAHVLCAYPVTR